jgi:hypothetical protein
MFALLLIAGPLLGAVCLPVTPLPLRHLVPVQPASLRGAGSEPRVRLTGLTREALEHAATEDEARRGHDALDLGQALRAEPSGLRFEADRPDEPTHVQVAWRIGGAWSLRLDAGRDPLRRLAGRYDPDDDRHLFLGISFAGSW